MNDGLTLVCPRVISKRVVVQRIDGLRRVIQGVAIGLGREALGVHGLRQVVACGRYED